VQSSRAQKAAGRVPVPCTLPSRSTASA
jgi:hypothetical protein